MADEPAPQWEWVQAVPVRMWYGGFVSANTPPTNTYYSHYGHGTADAMDMYVPDPPDYKKWELSSKGLNPFNVPGDYIMLMAEIYAT